MMHLLMAYKFTIGTIDLYIPQKTRSWWHGSEKSKTYRSLPISTQRELGRVLLRTEGNSVFLKACVRCSLQFNYSVLVQPKRELCLGTNSSTFSVGAGLRQGCPLSPGLAASSEGVQLFWGLVHKWWQNGASDGQTDWCIVCSNVVTVAEEGAEPEDLLVHLHSKPDLWSQALVVNERARLWIQAAEMSALRRVDELNRRDRVRSSNIWRELGVEPLLLRVKRSQLKWFGHLIRMPPGRLPLEVFQARPTGRRRRGRPRTGWRDYISSGLGTPLDLPEGARV